MSETPTSPNSIIPPLNLRTNSHHRQFMLLNKGIPSRNLSNGIPPINTSSLSVAPVTSPRSSGTTNSKKKVKTPFSASKSRFIFSVDDGEDEIEQDLEREYLEGYNDALKGKIRKKKQSLINIPENSDSINSINAVVSPNVTSITNSAENNNINIAINENLRNPLKESYNSLIVYTKSINELESEISQNLVKASEGLKELECRETDSHTKLAGDVEDLELSIVSIIDEGQPQPQLQQQLQLPTLHRLKLHRNFIEETENEAIDNKDNSNIYIDDNGSDAAGNENDNNSDTDSLGSMESFTLRERQDAINETHPFGIRIWKPAIYKKFRSVQQEADKDIRDENPRRLPLTIYIVNLLWTCSFGLISFSFCLAGVFCLLISFSWLKDSIQYVKLFWNLGVYLLYPFGKVVYLWKDQNYLEEDLNEGMSVNEFIRWVDNDSDLSYVFTNNKKNSSTGETRPLLSSHEDHNTGSTTANNNIDPNSRISNSGTSQQHLTTTENQNYGSVNEEDEINNKLRLFGRGQWSVGRICFFLYFYIILQPVLAVISSVCWLGVFTIPMAKVIHLLLTHLRKRPLALHIRSDKSSKIINKDVSVLISTYRAAGFHYYKYIVDGTNVIILNLMALVIFVIADFYILKEYLELELWITDSLIIFVLCLLSIIPLAYFIGQAVASISAQSSMGVGAVINAFFSTVVEIFLYCVALSQEKGLLVEGSMIGSVLGAVLLLPGLSMCAGAIRRKTQRYNPRSAGVSSTMLLFSTVVMFAPTIFHQIFGSYYVTCVPCDLESLVIENNEPLSLTSLFNKYLFHNSGTMLKSFSVTFSADPFTCQRCYITQPPLKADLMFIHYLKPFALASSSVLFISYIIALYFTLRTHAALIWQTPTSGEQQHQSQSQRLTSTQLQPVCSNSKRGLKSPSILSLNDVASPPSSSVQPSKIVPSITRRISAYQSLSTTNNNNNSTLLNNIGADNNTKRLDEQVLSPKIQPINDHQEEVGGHDSPNWSRQKSSVILLGATVLYAIIAEILVDCVDVVLKQFSINPKFLGLTVFALVPNTTEFLNAINFAMYGNVALSMEIGSAYVLQVLQLQIPAIVVYSAYRFAEATKRGALDDWNLSSNMLTLIFSKWDCIASVTSVFIFTYIYAEGKSNYFKGSLLILLYMIVMLGFYYSGEVDPDSFFN